MNLEQERNRDHHTAVRSNDTRNGFQEISALINMLKHIHQNRNIKCVIFERINFTKISDEIHFGVRHDIERIILTPLKNIGEIAVTGANIQNFCIHWQFVDNFIEKLPVGFAPGGAFVWSAFDLLPGFNGSRDVGEEWNALHHSGVVSAFGTL